MKDFRQRVICEEHRHQGKAGDPHPPVGRQHVVALQLGEHVPPARDGLAHAQPEEGKRHFRQDVLRGEEGGLGEEQPEGLGGDVPADQVEVGGAEAPGGQHVVALAGAQHHAAEEAGRAGPVDEADDEDHEQERLARRHVQGQHRPHREESLEPGQGQEQLGAPHEHGVEPAKGQWQGARRRGRSAPRGATARAGHARSRRCREGRCGRAPPPRRDGHDPRGRRGHRARGREPGSS